jgi:putative hemolysin
VTPLVVFLATSILLVLLFIAALACFSLRDFSRTRLDEVCERKGKPDRFLEIMGRWESSLVAFELLLVLVAMAAVVEFIIGFDLIQEPTLPGASGWFNLTMKWVASIITVLAVAIVFPRSFARTRGERFLFGTWRYIELATVAMKPAVRVAQWVDKVVHRLYGLDDPKLNDPEALADEIRKAVDTGARLGALNKNASSMIDQVMDLKDADVASVMTPRTEMCHVSADLSLPEALAFVLDAGHTRLPLIGESTDDIVGILYAKDLLRFSANPEDSRPLTEIAREPFYVPETTSIDKLLENMNRKRVHMAIVLDEYGGVAGLVTMEDVLEEIVGEIVDEYDEEEVDLVQRISDSVNEVDSRAHIDDLIEEFEYSLPEDRDYDTIGGFVFKHLGRIPEADEEFQWGDLKIKILEADKRRVYKLRIQRISQMPELQNEPEVL